jgi:hypothetical protein
MDLKTRYRPQQFQWSIVKFSINPIDQDRIIEMAWDDRTPVEAILFQFGLTEADVIALMRKSLKRSSFN